MKIAISLALVASGFALLGFGIEEANSFQSKVVEFFTGEPTEQALGLMVSGIAVVVLGLIGMAANCFCRRDGRSLSLRP